MIVEYLSSTTKNTALNPKSFAEKSENTRDYDNRKIKNMIVLYGDVGTPTVRNEVPATTVPVEQLLRVTLFVKVWKNHQSLEWSQIIMSHKRT